MIRRPTVGMDSTGRLHARAELADTLERYRVELTRHCCRILGSWCEAEDAVQETMVRAWRSHGRFEGLSTLRTWLYRIATNVCIDMLKAPQRRALPIGLSSEYSPLDGPWIGKHNRDIDMCSGTGSLRHTGDPADLAVARETVRLALVLALHCLPPRQRAALLLREVLACPSTEIAELLDTSVASVNSALERGRGTLASRDLEHATPTADERERSVVDRYVEALERCDVDALATLACVSTTQLGV
jgi:RNA polymerase sigma-70 factor (ECF subfamily)